MLARDFFPLGRGFIFYQSLDKAGNKGYNNIVYAKTASYFLLKYMTKEKKNERDY